MLRRVGIGLAILVAGLVVLVLILIGSAQTGPGQRLLVRALNSALAGTVEIEGLSGSVPIDMRIDRLALVEQGEPWLTVEDLVLDWSPSRLIAGVIAIDRLSARRIEVAQLPESDADEQPPSDEPFRLPELPETLPLVQLDRLVVEELVLEQPVLGERAVFHVEGHAGAIDRGRAVEAALEVSRSDEATASVGLNATLALEPPTLNLDLRANDSGRLVEQLAGLEESGDFDLQLVGSGPLSAWRAELTAGGAGVGSATGVITLALREHPRLGLDLELHPSSAILPDDLEPVVGDIVAVSLDVTQAAAQRLRLQSLRLGTGPVLVDASGSFDFDAGTFDVNASAEIDTLETLGPLAGVPLEGRLVAGLSADGPFLQPTGALQLAGENLRVATARIDALDAELGVDSLAALTGEPAARAVLEARLERLVVDGVDLPPRDLEVALSAVRPPEAPVEVERFRLTDGNAVVEAAGSIDAESLAGTFDLRLAVERLAELTQAAGQEIGGRLLIIGPVRIADGAERIETELEATLENLTGLPEDVAPVAGERISLALAGAFVPGDRAVLDRLRLETAALKLNGQGKVGLERGELAAEIALGVPELSVLEPLARSEMAGALAASATVGGTLEAPEIVFRAGGEDLVLAGRPVTRLALEAEADGIEPSEGRLQLDLAMPRLEANLRSRYRFDGATLALREARLTGTGVEVTGRATTELASGLTTGRFEGRIAELGRLNALIPVALGGRLDLDLRLEERDGGQAVAAALEAVEVRGPFGRIERAALTAEIGEALTEPAIEARLILDDLRQEANRVDRLEIAARGGLDELALDFSTEGVATATFDLEGRTVVALGDATRVRVERLEGTVGEQPLRLAGPASLALQNSTVELSALDLRYAGGRLRAEAKLGPGPVAGRVRLDRLPLENLQSLGVPPLVGTLRAALALSGDAADPRIVLDLGVPNLRSPDPTLGDVPPLDLALDAVLEGRRLNADLRASGLTDVPITAEIALPLLANLEHFAFEVPESGALEGAVRADVRLRRIADLLALDGQRLEGRLQARLDLAGTVAAPAANGRITLNNGLYENGVTGTVLREITLRADATAERLVLRELTATDGGNGRLTGSGEVVFDGERNYPLTVQLEIRQAKLVRRDDLEATLAGRIGVEGDLQRSTVGGRIVVERAEVGLPDPSSGPDVAVLDVEEVGRGFGPEEEAAEPEEDDPRVVELDLTIVIPERFYVRGRGLESEWQGRLLVEGTLDEPMLVGDLEIKRGTFDFLDRRFDLEEGVIGFTGGLPPVPEIDVRAVAEADDITAVVEATGTPDDLEIRLTSDPELPEDEVLSRLLFNRDVSSISPTEAASLALAVNRLRGGGGLDILGRARKALGVDTLDVSSASGEQTVKAGKYLSDDVYVEVEKGAGAQSGRARVELEVLPNVSIEADTGEDARSGVGVKWQYDF